MLVGATMAILLPVSMKSSFATTIAVVRGPTSVAIAADTRLDNLEVTGSHRRSVGYGCKIHKIGDRAFGAAGLISSARDNFDPLPEITAALRRGGGLETISASLSKRLAEPLFRTISRLHRAMPPAAYQNMIVRAPSVLSIFIIEMHAGVPSYAELEFLHIEDSRGTPVNVTTSLLMCPSAKCPINQFSFGVIGSNSAVRQEVAKGHFFTGNTADDARKMVNIEVMAASDRVGGPVDVLLIDASGVHWQKPRGKCK